MKKGGLSWIEKHDLQLRSLAWLGAVAGAPDPSTLSHDEVSSEARVTEVVALSVEAQALLAAQQALVESNQALEVARAETAAARLEAAAARRELAAAKEAMTARVTTMCDDAERELVGLAMSVAARVVAREVAVEPELVIGWAREAIAGSALGDHFVVAVSPDLATAIEVGAWEELANKVRTDAALPGATCEVRDGGRVVTVSAEERSALVGAHILESVERVA